MQKKIVYIAHAISGDTKTNIRELLDILRKINLDQAKFGIDCSGVVPLCSYLADVQCLDDTKVEERKRGIENNTAILESGIIQELWLTGATISFGMQEEVKIAKLLGIPVINYINKF